MVAILIVDDDALLTLSAADMLEDLGYKAIQANSGPEALEILKRDESIDLMIVDYLMPKMSGIQLSRAARELRPDLRILLSSGYEDPPIPPDIDLPNLGKPYHQSQLNEEIRRLLESSPP